MKTKTMGILVILVFLGLIGTRVTQKILKQRSGAQPRTGRNGAVAVVTEPVRKQTVRDVRVFTGTILPQSQFLVAPKVAGRLEKLHVNIGQEVKSGDLIAQLDSQEYGQQVEQSRAELDMAKASLLDSQSALDIATRDLERIRELRKQQVASESEMDQAETRCRAAQAKQGVAQAQVKQREAALKADEVRLSYTQIRAEWDGDGSRVIGERFADEGAILRANDPIASILDLDTVLAVIYVIERDYPLILAGQPAVITTDAFAGKTFPGKIVRKAPLLKESSRQARVEIEIANPERLLAPGMFVRAGIQFAERENATVVPAGAVVRRNGQSGVFQADESTLKARFVPVTVGLLTADTAEITEPPLAGQVVTLGQHLLEDGATLALPAANQKPDPTSTKTPAKDRGDRR